VKVGREGREDVSMEVGIRLAGRKGGGWQ